MQNSQMIPNIQESSIMDSDVLITTTNMPTANQSMNHTMPEDMVFNAGHQLSIIVYRFENIFFSHLDEFFPFY